ncbi:Zinc finger C2H2-type [Pacmanvirus A23]|uniref:Zinc finger C2H2-type n=1 Tax=Pacmanvirus A23 TaxID=1932881 RepID=UPI000A091ECE|nr:Zinc finger C2H2-type [Pacmanvirus A23]SIP86154.1 Zinc finger C2H2-type [Pacmanvirus A23]
MTDCIIQVLEYDYVCDNCGMIFNKKSKLLCHRFGKSSCMHLHKKKESDDKHCVFCKRKFWFMYTLNKHFDYCPVRLAAIEAYIPQKAIKYRLR